ncbi:septal ring lytic transglycosylase RlpA family protein [Methylomonas sp. MgM2]
MALHRSVSICENNLVCSSCRSLIVQGALLLLLGGCASEPTLPPTPERADQPDYRNQAAYNKPYRVKGKVYYPLDTAVGYSERGIASWYGSESGTHTAMGSRFKPNWITAAHRTLPLPCKVRVTNLRNGKAIDVLVNDRGPFNDKRLIDLSRGAAMQLGITGLAEVQVEYVETASENF